MSVYEIKLTPDPQVIVVQFPSGTFYELRFLYQFTPDDCWTVDINDISGNPIVCGIPLVTGADLLAQYEYLGFGCSLYCTTDGDVTAVPKFYNLGDTAHLWMSV